MPFLHAQLESFLDGNFQFETIGESVLDTFLSCSSENSGERCYFSSEADSYIHTPV